MLNKEIFTQDAGKFMTIDKSVLACNRPPSSWFTLAENLELTKFSQLNWKFLESCKSIKRATLIFDQDVKVNLNKLKEFLINSRIDSLIFSFEGKVVKEEYYELIKVVHNHLYSLEISWPKLNFDQLLAIEFPNLRNFTSHKPGTSSFEKFGKFFPNIKFLSIATKKVRFVRTIPDTTMFKHLKTLYITSLPKCQAQQPSYIDNIIQFQFPNLEVCKLILPFLAHSFDGISECMPNLKKFAVDISYYSSNELFFPPSPIPGLEELNLFYGSHGNPRVPVHLLLNNTPKLTKIGLEVEVILENSKVKSHGLISSLTLHKNYPKDITSICETLNRPKEVSLYCTPTVFMIFERIKYLLSNVFKLHIHNLNLPLRCPVKIRPLYKTTHLTLSGSDFLTDLLLDWLKSQSQLKYLTLNYFSEDRTDLVRYYFPNLLRITINCPSIAYENYLKYNLLCRSSEFL